MIAAADGVITMKTSIPESNIAPALSGGVFVSMARFDTHFLRRPHSDVVQIANYVQ